MEWGSVFSEERGRRVGVEGDREGDFWHVARLGMALPALAMESISPSTRLRMIPYANLRGYAFEDLGGVSDVREIDVDVGTRGSIDASLEKAGIHDSKESILGVLSESCFIVKSHPLGELEGTGVHLMSFTLGGQALRNSRRSSCVAWMDDRSVVVLIHGTSSFALRRVRSVRCATSPRVCKCLHWAQHQKKGTRIDFSRFFPFF